MSERSQKLAGGRVVLGILAGLLALGGLYLIAAPWLEIGGVHAPRAKPPTSVRLDQGWNAYDSMRFHHTSQGTKILPLSWFMALEQPVLTVLPVSPLASRDYLGRFGFVYETPKPRPGDRWEGQPASEVVDLAADDRAEYEAIVRLQREHDLPVGFAIERDFWAPFADPPVSTPTPVVGLTCAACHTGRIDVGLEDGTTRSVLVDGGSAMIHISLFQRAVGQALYLTQLVPERFRRFSRAVLGGDLPDEDPRKVELRDALARYISLGLGGQQYAKEHKLNGTEAGVSRTDALGLIGNRVFGVLDQENQVVTDAPVNFPHLWGTPWFDWVQYNASIRTPMARNIGEALGVGALINLSDPNYPPYQSTVNVGGLDWMEATLGGTQPFAGLQPPRWNDMVMQVFGKPVGPESKYYINPEKADRGSYLYQAHCVRCHLQPRDELMKELANPDSIYFTKPDPGSRKRFVRLNVVDLNVVGTDPNQALNFYRRVAVAPESPPDCEPVQAGPEQQDASKRYALGEPYAYWSPGVKSGSDAGGRVATISAEDGLFRVTSMIRRREYGSPSLQLLPPELTLLKLPPGRGDELPTRCYNRVVLGLIGDRLHCRVFNAEGKAVVDTVTQGATGKAADIETLKTQLEGHWPPEDLTRDQKDSIIRAVGSTFDVAYLSNYKDEDARRKRERWDRYRTIPAPLDFGDERAIMEAKGKDWVIRANLGYRARPHDGVWATPPFLHNGSVPNLYQMLVPASKRSPRFYLGSTRFDPVHVGYETIQFDGAFEMDTTLPGNSNAGHEFRNLTLEELEPQKWDGKSTPEDRWAAVLGVTPQQLSSMTPEGRWRRTREASKKRLEKVGSPPIKGVLGPEFTDEERWEIVEYLKTL
jgi:hypothetical protein